MTVDQADFHNSIARVTHNGAAKLDLGNRWHIAVADAVMQLPAVRAWIDCEATVEKLRSRHVEKKWAADSQSSSCGGCGAAWPCADALALGWREGK